MSQFHAHLSDDEALSTIYAMTQLNGLTCVAFNVDGNSPVSMGNSFIDSASKQTQRGLFLECESTAGAGRAFPKTIISPWGEWDIAGGGYFGSVRIEELWRRLSERVQLQLVHDRGGSGWGAYGPLYAVEVINGVPLEHPVMADERSRMPYDVANEYWQQLWQYVVNT